MNQVLLRIRPSISMTGRWLAILACATLAISVACPPVWGVQGNTGPGLGDGSGAANTFQKLTLQIRKNEADISQLYASMPIGFAKEQQLQLDKISEIKTTNEVLRSQLDRAALESFQAAPQDSPSAVRHVFETMVRKNDGKAVGQLFDPVGALEIANLMDTSGFDAPPVLYQAFRACFAIQDFERADIYLKKIESKGDKMSREIHSQFNDAKGKWQGELKKRSADAAADDLPRVKFVTTEGEFVIELFENEAPQTVANFVSLVEKKFYDGLTFHLVRPSQFAQAGCPVGDGSGNPGYRIANETDRTDLRNFFAGTVGMTHNGPGTAGSQFFIANQSNASYDESFVAFGRVIEGLNVVYTLKRADKAAEIPIPGEPSKIISASVIRKRNHPYEPVKIDAELGGIPDINSSSPSGIPDVSPDK